MPKIGRVNRHHLTHEDGGADEINATGLVGAGGDPGDGHVSIFPWAYSAIVAGTWLFSLTVAQILNGVWTNGSHALNDEIEFKAFLAAGTYTVDLLGLTATYGGISEIYIDGVSVLTVDQYSNPGVYNVNFRATGIVVAASGLKTITAKVTGKNAGSSDHYFLVSGLSFFRTA